MLLLTSTSDKIQLLTGQAVDVDVHTSAIDLASGAVSTVRKNTKITTATTTDIVDSPAASTARNVKTIHVENIHASSSVDVSVLHTDGATSIRLEKVTLLAGERLAYVEGIGFEVFDSNGLPKVSAQILAGSLLVAGLAADQSNSTVTPTAVTGLTQPCGVGTWVFEYFLRVQSGATTTGHRFSVNHTGTVTAFNALLGWPTALGTASDANVDQDILTAAGGLMAYFAARTKSTAGWGTTLSVDTANADVLYTIQGLMTVTVAGNIELWHGSEVAAASTVKAGSALRLTRIG